MTAPGNAKHFGKWRISVPAQLTTKRAEAKTPCARHAQWQAMPSLNTIPNSVLTANSPRLGVVISLPSRTLRPTYATFLVCWLGEGSHLAHRAYQTLQTDLFKSTRTGRYESLLHIYMNDVFPQLKCTFHLIQKSSPPGISSFQTSFSTSCRLVSVLHTLALDSLDTCRPQHGIAICLYRHSYRPSWSPSTSIFVPAKHIHLGHNASQHHRHNGSRRRLC